MDPPLTICTPEGKTLGKINGIGKEKTETDK
jgi:hypothetical protein